LKGICASIWTLTKKKCLIKKVVANHANIKVPHTSPAILVIQKKIHFIRIKDEIKFLYKEKHKLNNDLYKIHLKAAQEWGTMWHTILDPIIDATNHEVEKEYRNIDIK